MRLRQLLALGSLAVLLAGCTDPADVGETNTNQLPGADVNAQPRDALQPGGEVRVGVDQLASYNPMSAANQTTATPQPEITDFRRAFLPSFFTVDDKGVATPNTNFLESATETSQDPTVVTLKFNPRAVWGDGKPLSAQDLIATWTACNGRTPGFRCAETLKFNQIAEVKQGESPAQAIVTFNRAYPEWRTVFSEVSVLRAESVGDPATFNDTWTNTVKKEWSSGPFVPESYDPESKSLVTVPNPLWWGDKPLLERFTVRTVAAQDQLQAYSTNTIDLVDLGSSQQAFDVARTVPDFAIRRAGSTHWRQLVFNTRSSGPVSEEGVRKAVQLTLDRSAIGTAAYRGMEFTAAPLNNRFFMPAQEAYADNVEQLKLFRDLNAARKALDDAGWADADGTRTRDGRPLELRILQAQGDVAAEAEATAIADQLRQVGIAVTVDNAPQAAFADGTALSGGNFDLVVADAVTDPQVDNAEELYGSAGNRNYARFESPEVDGLLQQLTTQPNLNDRQATANQLDQVLWQRLPSAPLYQRPETVATRNRLANLGAPGLSDVNWENVGFSK